jgi:hypothetical protein
MSRPFWLRPLRLTEKSVLSAESVIKAAVRNGPVEVLLRTSAAFLLENTKANRAGVCAEEIAGDPVWTGHLAQTEGMGSVSERCKVNAFEAFPVEFNDANSPLEFFAPVFPVVDLRVRLREKVRRLAAGPHSHESSARSA